MSLPVPVKPPGKTWRELNQQRKAEKRKRNEEKILKQEKRQAIEKETELKAKEESEREAKLAEISTLSIAVPGSILENAQSRELRTYLAGQVARAACIFNVDEVIVYDDMGDKLNTKKSKLEDIEGLKVARKSCVQLARILQYLECPQYLRKHFFPIHKDLEFAGLLNPLDAPHHLRSSNDFQFREGVTMNKKVKPGRGSQVNVGLLQDVSVDKLLNPGVRVTVKMLPQKEGSKKLRGRVVGLWAPRAETGVYWGYTVRLASCISQVFAQCPYKDGYDLTIGTSDRGRSVDELGAPGEGPGERGPLRYRHALIVFGGLHGIEAALEADDTIKVDEAELLFDEYVNVLPGQGSRTIRTEEALLVALAALRTKLRPENPPRPVADSVDSLPDTKSPLPSTKASLPTTKSPLPSTKSSLVSTKSSLVSTKSSLVSTKSSLNSDKSLLNSDKSSLPSTKSTLALSATDSEDLSRFD